MTETVDDRIADNAQASTLSSLRTSKLTLSGIASIAVRLKCFDYVIDVDAPLVEGFLTLGQEFVALIDRRYPRYPPECGVTSPARGDRSRSALGTSPVTPSTSEIRKHVAEMGTNVNINVTLKRVTFPRPLDARLPGWRTAAGVISSR